MTTVSKSDAPIHIVLVEPVIPQNTGSTARLAAATGCHLHLIKPLGFELSDRYLKRAGLDYWPEVRLTVHESWDDFLTLLEPADEDLWLFSTHGIRSYTDVSYVAPNFLVFGNETSGLERSFHERYKTRRLRIPIDNPKVRSLNLSNAVSIAVYEARRQLGL